MNLWADLQGWTPLRLFWQEGQAWVEWVWAGDQPLGAEFYDFWLSGLLKRPFNLLFRRRIPLETLLAEEHNLPPGLPLSGMVLHMSRCGSTLAARLLACLPEHRVLSEPYILQKLLLNLPPDPQLTDDVRVAWLCLMVHLLGLPRSSREERLFIKFDALAGLRIDLLIRAFPDTPWVFLYRQPVEVLVSQTREAAGGLIPGYLHPTLLDSDYPSLFSLPLSEYMALTLGKVCEHALAHLPQHGLALNYRRLPAAAWNEMAGHFGLALTPEQIQALQEAARYNAKSAIPQRFEPDTLDKQKAATPELCQAARHWLDPIYEKLEAYNQE